MSTRISSMSYEHEAHSNTLKVLLIDDNPLDLLTYTAELRRSGQGVEVRTASDLATGVELVQEWLPDAIVLDLSLQETEGLETFQLLKRQVIGVPVVILSGSRQEDLILKLVEKGAQDFLVKGAIREGELLRAIRLAVIRVVEARGSNSETRLASDSPVLSLPADVKLPSAQCATAENFDNGSMASLTGSYFITGQLGSGGTANLVVAQHIALEREVALKILRPDRRSRRSELLLQTEAQIMAQLEHPNIIPIYEVGSYFIVMRRVEGMTMQEWISGLNGDLNRPFLIHALSKVCDALLFSHSKDVIHRDIKPDNIMLGRHGEVYLMDWGLALSMGTPEQGKPIAPLVPEDQAKVCSGTPSYLAPEIAAGLYHKVSFTTDVFLLGATLYHMLAGRAPYHGVPTQRILHAAAAGLFRPIADCAPEAPPPLQELCINAMNVEPQARPSVASFKQSLEDWLSSQQRAH